MSRSCLHIRSVRSPLVVRLVRQRPRQQPSPESKPLRSVCLAARRNGAEAARLVRDSAATMPNQTAIKCSEVYSEGGASLPLLLFPGGARALQVSQTSTPDDRGKR